MIQIIKDTYKYILLYLISIALIVLCFNQIYKEKFVDYYIEGKNAGEVTGYKQGYQTASYYKDKEFEGRKYEAMTFCEVEK